MPALTSSRKHKAVDAGAAEHAVSSADDIQFVDPQSPAPSGEPCEACGSPVEPLDRFCQACGAPNPGFRAAAQAQIGPGAVDSPSVHDSIVEAELVPDPSQRRPAEMPQQRHIQCQTCGAEVAIDPDQRSYVCAFCDSTMVVDLPASNRQPPEFVIGFAFTPEEAQEKFRQWLHDGNWFRPSDLVLQARTEQFKGVYLPFWSFSMLAESVWRSNIGMHWYRTETYRTTDAKGRTVTRTRQVQETEWFPLAGRHHHYYSGYLVSASKGLSQREADLIMPYHLPAARRYEPYFLAGWISEEYSIDRDQALITCQEEFRRREKRNVAAFQPGDTHSLQHVETTFSNINSDLWFIPVYLLHYRYQGKRYKVLINGQTGKLYGDKPLSTTKIMLAVGAVIGVIVLVVGVIALLASR